MSNEGNKFSRRLGLAIMLLISALLYLSAQQSPAEASEQSLRDSLTTYGLNNPEVSVTASEVVISYVQALAEISDYENMLDRVADILDFVTQELGAEYSVFIEQHFDDNQTMRVGAKASLGTAYLQSSLSAEEFVAGLRFRPLTRGPILVEGDCSPGSGNNCENCAACACYPGEICDPDNPAANDRGCVVVSPPANAHLECGHYVCDEGFEWNEDLTACVALLECPENAFKFQGECECEDGYVWNSDKSACVQAVNLYYPHLACTGGWESEICLINSNPSQSLSGTMVFYANNGLKLGEEQTIELAPHARYQFTLNAQSPHAADLGYIVFTSFSEEMCGYLKFFQAGKYRVAIPAAREQSSAGNFYVSHIASDNVWWTGVSLLNTSPNSKKVTMIFNDGRAKSITLAGNQHRAFSIASLFDAESQPDLSSAQIDADGIVGLQLFGGGNQLSGILLKNETATSLYYPHLVSDNQWWTGIVAYNPQQQATSLQITPYSDDGLSLAPQTFSLGGHEKYLGTLSSLNLPPESAWFKIESSLGITGFELFGTLSGNMLAGYTGVAIAANKAIFPRLEDNGWTGIAFANLSPNQARIDLNFYSDAGTVVTSGTLYVDGFCKVLGSAENLLRLDTSGANYMDYSSDQEVVGFQLNGSADNMMLDGLPGL